MSPLATAEKRRAKAELRSQAERKSPERKEDISSPACLAARDCASLRAWKKQRCEWPARRGVRHWRPSAKVHEHKPERSFLGVAEERPFSWAAAGQQTERLVDMEVSRKEGFKFQEF